MINRKKNKISNFPFNSLYSVKDLLFFARLMGSKIIFLSMLLLFSNLTADGLKINNILFKGNSTYKTKEIKKIIYLKKGKNFDLKQLKIDKVIIKNFYLSKGYLKVWVEDSFIKSNEGVDVEFKITEGTLFLFDSLKITGLKNFSLSTIKKIFKKNISGEAFNKIKIEESINNLENHYYNKGFPYVNIYDELEYINDSLIVVKVNISSGPKTTIDNFNVWGTKLVKNRIVEREIGIQPGEIYSRNKINETQKKLYATGLFETIHIQAVPNKKDSTKATLMVQVNEKKMKYIKLKAGLGFEENSAIGTTFEPSAELGHLNLFGTSRSIFGSFITSFSYDLNAKEIINPQNQLSATYKEPWVFKTKMPGLFQVAFFQRNQINSPDYDVWNYSFRIKKQMKNYWTMANRLEYQYITNIASAKNDSTLKNIPTNYQRVLSLKFDFIRDRRDNVVIPSRGYLTELRLGISQTQNPKSSSNSKSNKGTYVSANLSWKRYQAFTYFKKWVLASRLKGGYIHFIDKESILPLSEMYTLGGASTVRGYQEQLVGPYYYDNDKIKAAGGKIMLLSNVEMRIPVWELFFVTSFVDAGSVWQDLEDINLKDIRIGTGGGVAISLQVLVIRLEYGLKLFKKSNEKNGQFHFGVSFAF